MSSQEERSVIIRQNIPELIKRLLGDCNDDRNMRHCEQFAVSIIRNHRNLSTNSHEVRRKLEGIKEKFQVDNFAEYSQYLEVLSDEIVQHPLCLEHYEIDVGWSILDFLLTLSYNPTGALRRNKDKIDHNRQKSSEDNDSQSNHEETEYLKNMLKEDFISVQNCGESDSELSDWSEDVSVTKEILKPNCFNGEKAKNNATLNNDKVYGNIKPPEKELLFKYFSKESPTEHLQGSVQHSWWMPSASNDKVAIESIHTEANFAESYSRFLSQSANNMVRCQALTTSTEQNLLREVLWMFHSPQPCKFFTVTDSTVTIRENVTVPSVTFNGLSSFLEHNFLAYINMMQILRKFHETIYSEEHATLSPPRTLECYAANLRLLLQPVWKNLLECERRLLIPRDFEINTIIDLQRRLHDTFAQLEHIFQVHQQVVLNLRQFPAHISSAYLLASLMRCSQNSSNSTKANLAMSLFLSSVKIYCIIIDTWWTEGRLDDWQQEFIVERTSTVDHTISVRQYCKNKEEAFFVPTNVSKTITENSFFCMLLEHSLEAGCTLNLLYEINRIGDLRNACDAIEGKLYNVFIDDVLKHLKILQSHVYSELDTQSPDSVEFDTVDNNKILSSLTTTEDFLLLAFATNMKNPGDECDATVSSAAEKEKCALEIFKQLECKNQVLPLEDIILNSLSRILRTRIAFANSFVMRLYREEFAILKHLRNIRRVLLLESSDLMHQFYEKLFKQIESGQPWANPFLLTMQLDDIICSKFSEMSSLFHLEINSPFRCQTNKVFEAVDELVVTYNFSRELLHIITPRDIQEYNKIFRFLLKVKWGIMTLENLQFPRAHRLRLPYAPFEMIDLLMRRLEQLRFWMMYAMQSIHFHLMTHVLQSMGFQLEEKIAKCTNLKEMIMVHRSYVNTVSEHCFLVDHFNSIKLGIEQLLNLTFILRLEWNSCVKYIEQNSPLALNIDDSSSADIDNDYIASTQIDAIELTYVRCHQYLANKLNNEVYLNQMSFLSGLSAAFNTSLPH